jgi:hypothetical protein
MVKPDSASGCVAGLRVDRENFFVHWAVYSIPRTGIVTPSAAAAASETAKGIKYHTKVERAIAAMSGWVRELYFHPMDLI